MFNNGNGNAYRNGYRAEHSAPPTPVKAGGGKKRVHQRLTLKQQLDIADRLRQVCDPPVADYPWAKYHDGFNDNTIAQEFGFTPYAISLVRLNAIGKLKVGDDSRFAANGMKGMAARIETLEADVMELRRRMGLISPVTS